MTKVVQTLQDVQTALDGLNPIFGEIVDKATANAQAYSDMLNLIRPILQDAENAVGAASSSMVQMKNQIDALKDLVSQAQDPNATATQIQNLLVQIATVLVQEENIDQDAIDTLTV